MAHIKVVSCLSVSMSQLQLAASEWPCYFYTGAGCYKVTLFNIGQEEFRAPLNAVMWCWEGIHRMTENKLLQRLSWNKKKNKNI